MTPEERKMLEEVRALAQENNEVLKSIQRSQRAGAVFKIIYWVIILGLSFGAYWLIQPYVNMLKSSLSDATSNPSATADSFTLSGALSNLKELQSLYK